MGKFECSTGKTNCGNGVQLDCNAFWKFDTAVWGLIIRTVLAVEMFLLTASKKISLSDRTSIKKKPIWYFLLSI